jgi:hypothetical protein
MLTGNRIIQILTVVLLLQTLNLYSQLAPGLPSADIAQKKIKRITQYQINSKDTMPYSQVYYYNGLLRQITGYHLIDTSYREAEIDPNYKGKYLIYNEIFAWDDKPRVTYIVGTWTGTKDPDISEFDYKYSANNDTVYQYIYHDDVGRLIAFPRYERCRITKDTIELRPNYFAVRSINNDTINFLQRYRSGDLDSIVTIYNDWKYYEVYRHTLLISTGHVGTKFENGKQILMGEARTFFDNEGYPFRATYYHYSGKDTIQIRIVCEKYN